MKIRMTLALISALAAVACSSSPTSMLKSGNPKVCALSDITRQVTDIIKENVQSPSDEKALFDDYNQYKQKWLSKISFNFDKITSISVDTNNQSIDCNGNIHMKANGLSEEYDRNVDYRVKSDLSSNEPIVSVDLTSISGALAALISKVSQPDFSKAQDKRDIEEDKMAEQEELKWYKDNPGGYDKIQSEARIRITPLLFDLTELSYIDKIHFADRACRESIGDLSNLFCRRQRRLEKKAKDADLCNTAGNEWYHCSRENELEEQRTAYTKSDEYRKEISSNPFYQKNY